jgi:hypothetical protein
MLNNPKYRDYSAEELLQDDYFVESQRNPTPESKYFWQSQVDDSKVFSGEWYLACQLLRDIHVGIDSFTLTSEQQSLLFSRIQTEQQEEEESHSEKSLLFRVLLRKVWLGAVASLLLFLSIGGYLHMNRLQEIDYTQLAAGFSSDIYRSDEISLTLPSEQIIIKEKEAKLSYTTNGKVSLNGAEYAASSDERKREKRKEKRKIEFNKLYVPVGHRSTITFSDGTKMWVNAGTKVIYPASFAENKREIYVEGEVFLDVVSDANRPFIVKTSKLDVEVKGTSFNVSSYAGEEDLSIVLVEGAVRVLDQETGKECHLSPNERYCYNVAQKTSKVDAVNVDHFVAWKGGYYQFKQEPLGKIFAKLSRYYGVKITWDEGVVQLTCSGKLDIKNDLKEVLEILTHIVPIQVIEQSNGLHLVLKP